MAVRGYLVVLAVLFVAVAVDGHGWGGWFRGGRQSDSRRNKWCNQEGSMTQCEARSNETGQEHVCDGRRCVQTCSDPDGEECVRNATSGRRYHHTYACTEVMLNGQVSGICQKEKYVWSCNTAEDCLRWSWNRLPEGAEVGCGEEDNKCFVNWPCTSNANCVLSTDVQARSCGFAAFRGEAYVCTGRDGAPGVCIRDLGPREPEPEVGTGGNPGNPPVVNPGNPGVVVVDPFP